MLNGPSETNVWVAQCLVDFGYLIIYLINYPPKFNIAPEKWWLELFSGAMLNFGRVIYLFIHLFICSFICLFNLLIN